MQSSYLSRSSKAKSRRRKTFRDLTNKDVFARKALRTKGFLAELETRGISNLHGARLGLAGLLSKIEAPKPLAFSIVRAGLGDYRDSELVVNSTYKRAKEGLPISGGAYLRGIIGHCKFSKLLEHMAHDIGTSVLELRRVILFKDDFPVEDTRDFSRMAIPILRELGLPKIGLSRLHGLAVCKVYETQHKNNGEVIYSTKHRCGRKVCKHCRERYWRVAKELMKERLKSVGKVDVVRLDVTVDDLLAVRSKVWRVSSGDVVIYTDFYEEQLVVVGDVKEAAHAFGVEIETYDSEAFVGEVFHAQVFSLFHRFRDHLRFEGFIDRILEDPWLSGQTHTYSARHETPSLYRPPSEREVREIIKEEAIQLRIESGRLSILDLEPDAKQEVGPDGHYNFEFEHRNSVTKMMVTSTEKPIPPWEIRLHEMAILDRCRHLKVRSRMKEKRQLE